MKYVCFLIENVMNDILLIVEGSIEINDNIKFVDIF